jgi:hypothetical protein
MAHSLYSYGDTTLAVMDGVLHQVDAAGNVTSVGVYIGAEPLSYTHVAGKIFFSNSTVTGTYFGSTASSWGIETPTTTPTIAPAVGILPGGEYLLTCTFISSSGEESGSNLPVVVTVPDNSGLLLTNLPIPIATDVVAVNLYLSTAGGSVLYHVASVPIGSPGEYIYDTSSWGAQLRTTLVSPMPAGTSICASKGRVFSFVGNTLYYSEALRYGLCDFSNNYQMFASAGRALAGLITGIYIVTDDETFFWEGPDSTTPIRSVAPYGGVRNSVSYLPDGTGAIWLSTRGMVHASLDGELTPLTDGKIAMKYMGDGGTLCRESNGVKQYLGVASSMGNTALAASSYMNVSITRATQ